MKLYKTLCRISILCISLVFFLSFSISCSKECDCGDINNNDDKYFIKYEASNSSKQQIISGDQAETSVTIMTPSGEKTYRINKTFSETFGPFKYGDNTSISVINLTSRRANVYAKIYLSKNNEPFVLKASSYGENSTRAKYTIIE